jgi:outer membrane lipoprotein carrier protein
MPPAAQAGTVAASPVPQSAGSGELKDILKRLQRHYQSTGTFSARFKQQISTLAGTRRDRSGTIAYRKPGRMRWEFDAPQPETIVSDGHILYSYEPDLNQVIETPLDRAFRASAPAALLLGIGNVERDFASSIPSAPPPDGLVHLVLKPRSGGAQVALGLDPKSYDLAKLTVTDELGNVTALEFSGIRTNVAFDDATFTFKVPEGADIVTAPGAAGDGAGSVSTPIAPHMSGE